VFETGGFLKESFVAIEELLPTYQTLATRINDHEHGRFGTAYVRMAQIKGRVARFGRKAKQRLSAEGLGLNHGGRQPCLLGVLGLTVLLLAFVRVACRRVLGEQHAGIVHVRAADTYGFDVAALWVATPVTNTAAHAASGAPFNVG